MSDQEINAISGLKPFHPSYPDPFTMFDSFPSHHIKEDGKIDLHITNWPEAMKLISLKAGYVIADSLIELEELPFLFENLEKNTDITIKQLVDNLPNLDPNKIILTVAWLIKLGICRYNTQKQNKFI